MIPETKIHAVSHALREAFGVQEFDDIRRMTAGLSTALVFRIVVSGRAYLLRVIMNTDAISEPTRQFACMRSAADAGIAPRVLYTNTEDRVSITDFVGAKPVPRTEALARLPLTLQRLHALPPFPKMLSFPSYLDSVAAFLKRLQAARILSDSEIEELCQVHTLLFDVYPRLDSDMVSCHNDLKPENILFDQHGAWLVDWEAAFLNDRYVDLAVVANFVVTTDAERDAYLQTYFGEPAGDYRSAQFYLMSQVLHLFYTIIFLLVGSKGKPLESTANVPDFRHFHDQIWAGDISLASEENKLEYARVHRRQLLQNVRTQQFQEAVRITTSACKPGARSPKSSS